MFRRTPRYVPLKEPSSRKKHSSLCMDMPPKEVRIEHRLLLAAMERVGPESDEKRQNGSSSPRDSSPNGLISQK